jgi:hypothetical protein
MDAAPRVTPNPQEVEEVFSLPLSHLFSDSIKHIETRDFNGTPVDIPYYAVDGRQVWGATAVMLSELEGRLRAVVKKP